MTRATVTQITDESVYVSIETDNSQCENCTASCSQSGQVGGCSLYHNPDSQTIIEGQYIPSENDNLPINVGDTVYVDIKPETRVLSSLILFLIPIIALFGSYRLASLFSDNDMLNSIISASGLIISVIAVVLLFRNSKIKNHVKPYIYKVKTE